MFVTEIEKKMFDLIKITFSRAMLAKAAFTRFKMCVQLIDIHKIYLSKNIVEFANIEYK